MEVADKPETAFFSASISTDLIMKVLEESQECFVVLKAVKRQEVVTDFIYVLINRKAEAALGMTKEEIIGKSLLTLFPGTYLDGIFEFYQTVFNSGRSQSREFNYRHESFNNWFVQLASKLDKDHILVSTVDITVHKLNEQELERKQKALEEAQRLSKSGSWVFNSTTGRSTWNDEVFRLFNEKPDPERNTFEILERYVFPEDLKEITSLAQEAIENVSGYESKYRVKLSDGTLKMIATTARASVNELGEVVLNGTCQDITERWMTNEKLSSAEHFQKKVMQLVPGLIAVYNINTGRYIYINDAVTSMLGYSKQLVLDKGAEFLQNLVHPDDLPQIVKKNNALLEVANNPDTRWEDNEPAFFEYRLRDKDGNYKWFHTSGLVFDRNSEGKVEHVINISFDITERKHSEEQLRRNEALMNQAQQIASIGSWEWDIENDKVFWTDTLWKMYGYKPHSQNIDYSFFINHVHEEDRVRVENSIKKAFETCGSFSFEHRLKQPTGQVRNLVAKGNVIINDMGKPVKMIGVSHDITEHKQAETELRNLTIEAETQRRLNEKKDEFIGMASHELKTPLTSIKAYVQLLERHYSLLNDEPASTWLKRTSSYVDKLSTLVSDLLDISKINAGKLHFNMSAFKFQDMLVDTIEAVQQITPSHKILLQGVTNKSVFADRNRIEQVIINLLSNAIKYSPKANEVIVKVRDDKSDVFLEIHDKGIGIQQHNLLRIFDRFYRVDNDSKQFSGLGIGLYISNEIIKRHDGYLWAESQEGKGSVFCFRIPASN